MRVELKKAGKRYQYEWIIRGMDLSLTAPGQYAVSGPNGSGKSTFLKLLSGHLTPSEGSVQFFIQDRPVEVHQIYRHLTYAAPYIDLIEELDLTEAIDFHRRFKPLKDNLDTVGLIQLLGFQRSAKKQIRFFSSGMKQRLKLALAICSRSSFLLLDEPTSNLDQQGIQWYRQLIEDFASDRLIVVASNAEVDYDFCQERIAIPDFKYSPSPKKP